MSYKNLMVLLILYKVNTLCNEGCLKCNNKDQCQICNVSKFMKLEDSKCVKIEQDNCSQIALNGNCLSCLSNFYLDETSKKCVAIEKDLLIENCLFYDSKKQCLQCKTDFFTLNGKCIKVSIKISNCKIYLNDTTCQICNDDFLLTLDGKKCETKPSFQNCKSFSTVECVECNKEFLINKNIYQKRILNVNSQFESDFFLQWIYFNNNLTIQQDNVCQKLSVQNCDEVEDFDSCKKCKDGYYLTDSKFCLPYPNSIIQNCELYSSGTVCKKCANKYYKKNSSTCLPVTLVDNCVKYGETENDQGCKLCDSNYYLNGDTCKSRINQVLNCQEFDLTDHCKTCSSGYTLTNDRLQCLSSITNCGVYESSNKDTTALKCTKCIDGFFLVNGACQQGTDSNCAKFSDASTFDKQTCIQCKNKFYLSDDNNCIQIKDIDNCSQYHNTKDKSCLQCQGLFFNFQLVNKCEIVNEISNCITYNKVNTDIKCTKCADGYFLNTTDNKCEDISVSHPSCKQVDNAKTNCLKCQPFKILRDGKCIDNMPYNTEYCDKVNDDQVLQDADCEVCKENSFPYKFSTVATCLTVGELGTTLQVNQNLCKIYKDDGKCIVCKDGYVEDDGACVQSCPGGKYLIKFFRGKINYCVATSAKYVNDCEIMVYKNNSTDQICGKCKSGFLPYLVNGTMNWFYGKANDKNLDLIDNLLQQSIGMECQELTKNILLNGNANQNGLAPIPDANCLIWLKIDATNFHCQRCKDFYTFKISSATGNPENCIKDDKFNTQKIQSLNPKTLRYVSGYQCVDRSLFVLVQVSSVKKIVNTKSDLAYVSNQCVSKDQLNANFADSFVENCAVYIVENTTISCLECMPGYKQASSTSCLPIDNCIGFMWFSGCSQCDNQHALVEKNTKEIDYAKCQKLSSNLIQNCLVAKSNGDCFLCQKGYFLNYEKTCEKIFFPKCSSSESFVYLEGMFGAGPENYYMYYSGYNNGCNLCLENYVAVTKKIDTKICVFSQFLRDNSNNTDLFQFIAHCRTYINSLGADNELACEECYKGRLVNKTNTSCLNEVPNCKVIETGTKCKECSSSQYANIEGVCQLLNIENCLEYNVFTSQLKECKKCQDQYFKSGTKCIQTEVLNCKVPTSKTECSVCNDNFYKVELGTSRDYCLAKSNQTNCKKATIVTDGEYGGKFTCTECSIPNAYITTQQDTPDLFQSFTECIRIDQIENCGQLNIPKVLEQNSFSCQQCTGKYYLSDSSLSCLARTNVSLNCDVFDPNKDTCQTCNNTSYLVNENKDCQIFPDGLVGCKKYQFRYTCEICQIGFYLKEGKCVQIPQANLILNCEIYKSESACQQCIKGYFVNNNVCEKVVVSNCEILADKNTCQKCSNGYGLVTKGDVIDCEIVSKNRCLVLDQNKPYPCLICNEGFYPNDIGECTEAKPKIENCIQQESLTKCNKCIKGSVLSLDASKCYKSLEYVNKIPLDCDQAVERNPFCSTCLPGFEFDQQGQQCIQCTAVKEITGCMVCNPNDKKKCFMCKNGYKQNSDGICVLENSNGSDNEVQEVSLLNIMEICWFFLIGFFM